MKKIFFLLIFVLSGAFAFGQENSSSKSLEDVNVNFMVRGYISAGSKVKDEKAFGGFATSRNLPRPIIPEMNVRQGEISLVAKPDEETTFAQKYKGLKLLLINATTEQATFSAQDSRLYVVQEALDRDGKWKPIEYLPSSWCGNSYHTVFLGANEYWEFAAPRYTGEFQTKLRFRLDERKNETEKTTIYSNEFDGSVNAKQFTVKQGHNPTSIMDPYND